MSDATIPAVASAAFLGFLALAGLLFCVPPVARFLGDLCCCPWRLPFTRKRRRNDDEEVDKEDLPYLAEPRPDTPVDDTGYQPMPDAHMPARGTREQREDHGGPFRDQPPRGMSYMDDREGLGDDYYGGPFHDRHAPFPESHNRDWWPSPAEDYPEYPEYPEYAGYPRYPAYTEHGHGQARHYAEQDSYGYDKETSSGPDIQRPRPPYSPPEMASQHYTNNYFPGLDYHYYSQYTRS